MTKIYPVKQYEKRAAQLKTHWARFFMLAGLEWELTPRSESGFDFTLTLPCTHSECGGSHILLVRIWEIPLEALEREYDTLYTVDEMLEEPHPALFGDGPKNTWWQMSHGAGGGIWRLDEWLSNADHLWKRAEGR